MNSLSTANPTRGDVFESSELKARTSLLPRSSGKVRSSFELLALKQHSKMSPRVGLAVYGLSLRQRLTLFVVFSLGGISSKHRRYVCCSVLQCVAVCKSVSLCCAEAVYRLCLVLAVYRLSTTNTYTLQRV